jgi:XTP/dITP diphosphohydrolase
VTLLIATSNPDKLEEIRELLADAPVPLVSLRDFPRVPEPEETGKTFEENAWLKGQYYEQTIAPLALESSSGPVLTVAEDSGLVIDALDGEPGIRSARFLRTDASYPERFAEIYRRLAEHPERPRTARFVCSVAVVRNGASVFRTSKTVEGEIAPEPRGTRGFGYDPIFWYPPYESTLAEVEQASKLRVAHRGQAFRALADWLRSSQ